MWPGGYKGGRREPTQPRRAKSIGIQIGSHDPKNVTKTYVQTAPFSFPMLIFSTSGYTATPW